MKLSRSQGCLKTRSDLEYSIPAFNKHECWRSTKGTNQMQLIMCRFCSCCVKILQIVCLLNVGLEHSRSNLVFQILNNLFSECSIEADGSDLILVELFKDRTETHSFSNCTKELSFASFFCNVNLKTQ